MNNKYIALLSIILFSSVVQTYKTRTVVDTIVAVVYGEDKDDIAVITKSDITRPGIDGAIHGLDDKIFEKLLWFDAKKYRILQSENKDEIIERHLKSVERENNISRKDLIEIFRKAGYTFEEGKEQFGVMYTVNAMIDFKVRGGLFVSQKEVQSYYDENPEYVDATYILQRGLIPYDYSKTENEQLHEVSKQLAHTEKISNVEWAPAITIKQDQMAPSIAFIIDMKAGDISSPVLTKDGIEVFKLINVTPRRLRTFDERYAQIAEMLRRPKYQEILTNYKKELHDRASIVYF